ncbi:MAG: nucleotide sugar dehydrogenase, partial [Gemmatimonadales bacterium]
PLSKFKDPDMSYIQSAGRALTKTLRAGQIVILESTTYPGTTREILLPELESSGLSVGRDFFLAFSPERVDPGNTTYQTRNTPKVVGGITPDCLRVAMACYQPAIDTLVPVSTTEAAELVKLLENTFRSVNIGLANEMAIVCDKLGVDVWEVIDAAATKPFGFMRFLPGPGLGGHCIPIDPHYLAWKMRGLNYKTRFVDLAGEVNTEMPLFWIRKVTDQLNIQSKSVRGANVLVLGVAYKRDVEDIRESPALDIINLLEGQGAEVRYHDPNVPELNHDGKVYRSVTLTPDEVRHADCVIIVTDHTNVDYDMVRQNAKSVVDTRNVLGRTSSTSP